MASLVTPAPIEAVTFLVNEWGTDCREEAGEAGSPWTDRSSLLALMPGAPPSWSRTAHRRLVEIADALHPVFAATSSNQAVSRLNRLLADCGVRPRLHASQSGLALGWTTDSSSPLLAAAATSVGAHLTDFGPASIGICHGEHCVDVWADHRHRRRRYCSERCSVRTRVASFRSRQR